MRHKGDPVEDRARNKVRAEIRTGRLERPPCIVCGDEAEADHSDCSGPLDVDWLCEKHHSLWHSFAGLRTGSFLFCGETGSSVRVGGI